MNRYICLLIASLIAWNLFSIKQYYWNSRSEQEQSEMGLEMMAYITGMSSEEFELMSAVVEAESDRNPDHTEGKKLIALTIFNRQASEDFPNSITGVISQSGQFQVYYEGTYKQAGRTESSDRAVIEAYFWMQEEHPNVIFFNSIGFASWAEPYEYVDGNYFSLGG